MDKKIKLLTLLITITMCLINGIAQAESPRTIGKGNYSLGIRGIFNNQDLKETKEHEFSTDATANGLVNDSGYQKDWRDVKFQDNSVRVRGAIGLLDGLDIYAELGGAKSTTEARSIARPITFDADGHTGFSWALGIKGSYELPFDFVLGGSVKFTRDDYSIRQNVTENGVQYGLGTWVVQDDGGWFEGVTSVNYTADEKTKRLDVELSAGKQVDKLFIYGGTRHSVTSYSIKQVVVGYKSSGDFTGSDETKFRFRQEKKWGGFIGAEWDISKHMTLGTELTGGNEYAVAAGITYTGSIKNILNLFNLYKN